ncbi:acyl carrier protein [Streptomyces albireticuli]|uniref:Acyl carrier protein n=1 Tax=Streptomyces albireticuli TaxID=1940 RepID=A0A2A2D186_9ACTN|nr:acyl carrier protein [Streptomyces albireticuli]MCD9145732.1 acyl carrier protein [Streptomyces albireticuli]MCD9165536.1 acyl carrier protein [Streptomyces albireticuli]MCD9195941.1 acyl carrier protein [Streptomyces albireticuli]PAU45179.1 acyl carrier protein [Streptomyces albireticuli]
MADYFDRLAALLTRHFDIDSEDIREGVALSSLGMDSLSLSEFGLLAGEEFGISLSEDILFIPGVTLGDIARLIGKKAREG